MEGNFKIKGEFNRVPNRKDHKSTWDTDKNYVEIRPRDPNFHREGSYYFMIIPKPNFLEALNIWATYSFMINYVTEDSYVYLKT